MHVKDFHNHTLYSPCFQALINNGLLSTSMANFKWKSGMLRTLLHRGVQAGDSYVKERVLLSGVIQDTQSSNWFSTKDALKH